MLVPTKSGRRFRAVFDSIAIVAAILATTLTFGSPANASGSDWLYSSGALNCNGTSYNWSTARYTTNYTDGVYINFQNTIGNNWMYCSGNSQTIYMTFYPRRCNSNALQGWSDAFTLGWDGYMYKNQSTCWRWTGQRVYGSTGGGYAWFQGMSYW
jgi:hypothetical protein